MADNWRRWFRPCELEPMPPGMTCKPWYKERLPSKSFPKHKNRQYNFPTSLDGRRWVFLKRGLDDFRRGCPPCEGMITRGPSEPFLPTISHRGPRPVPTRKPGKLPRAASLLSTLSPAQQARRAFVEAVDASLAEHPLAIYPTLEEDVPTDLLLKALEVLDPDRKLEDKWAYCEGHRRATKKLPKVGIDPRVRLDLEPPRIPDSYQSSLVYEHELKKHRKLASVTFRRVPKGLKHFCRWVRTFGDLGIDEEFMMQQFDIVYECKPTYDASRIKKVNLLPDELKQCRKLSKVKEIRFSIQETDFEKKMRKPSDPYKPDWVKFRYGAWYLKPKLWKKLINDEPLIDPQVILRAEAEAAGQPHIIDELYGTIAFKDFIMSKGYSMPGFLEKLFLRKRWDYHAVSTPIPRVVKAHESLQNIDDEEEDDDD